MKKLSRRLVAVLLVLVVCIGGACAYSSNIVRTKFDLLLWQIEDNSLFTEDTEMSEAEREEINAYLQEHPEELERIVNEYLSSLDSHSMYLSESAYQSGFSTLTGYVGVGVGVQQTRAGCEVTQVFRSGPAYDAGVQVGDVVVAIDSVDVTALSLDEISEMLRGESGSTLMMTVLRDGQALTFTMIRRQVQQEYVSWRMVAPSIAYIRVEAMGSMDDLEAFREIWDGLDEKDTRAVILDLRSNSGGLIDVAFGMADLMLEEEGVYMGAERLREDMGGLQERYSSGGGLPLNALCVLVDENTASAAELLTVILKEAGGAEVLGSTTYGKGQGQIHMAFGDGSRLIVTTLEMLSPEGVCWEGTGITPTVMVENKALLTDYMDCLPPLETGDRLWYGECSDRVLALSGRLYVLGYGSMPSDRFDTTLLSALRTFQQEELGIAPTIYADDQVIEAVNQRIDAMPKQNVLLDEVYDAAFALCRQAACAPARYTVQQDGSWQAAA